MGNIQIGICNNYDKNNSIISQNDGIVIIGNEVTIDGIKMPPCLGRRNYTMKD